MQQFALLWLLALGIIAGSHTSALATCAPLEVAAWTADQRQFLTETISAVMGEEAAVSWITVGEQVRVCVRTGDASILSTASLQAQAQILVTQQQAAQTEQSDIQIELSANPLCRTATLAQILSRIDAEEAAMQTDIDAITTLATAKTALTTVNTRYSGMVKKLARCLVGYIRLQQER